MYRIFIAISLFCAFCCLSPPPSSAITIDTVPVGNVGNGNDPADGDSHTLGVQNFGRVDYAYRIGKYEVTIGQYTAFLNAVAATDTNGLYNLGMAIENYTAGIMRSGVPGTYTYSAIGSPNKPITFVSWSDAARFCNWLSNGQPTGGQVASTTEDGAYALDAVGINNFGVMRKAGAKWFIPTENEWYKAAYHKDNGPTSDYWSYPTRSNSEPNSDQPPGDPSIQTNIANFIRNDNIANGFNDGLAVTGSPLFDGSQNYLTDVGAYSFAPSPYGTFDRGGSVWEWNESRYDGQDGVGRGLRGGSWAYNSTVLKSSFRYSDGYMGIAEAFGIGFRVASIPEPTTGMLAIAAGGMLWGLRKRPLV